MSQGDEESHGIAARGQEVASAGGLCRQGTEVCLTSRRKEDGADRRWLRGERCGEEITAA